MSDATRKPARNAAQHPCQLTPIGVNSEDTLAQFTLIRRNSRSSSGFSRNLRKEVSKQDKIYFWDLGVRNVAIDNLKPLAERDDVGALWENFVLAERLKWLHYHQTLASLYFWRTYTGAEIDIVEEREGGIYAYECKWSQATRPPARVVPGRLPRRVVRGHHSGELPGVSGRIIAGVPSTGSDVNLLPKWLSVSEGE